MERKLLFLTPQLPYPPISGGTIKSWKLIEFLSKEYKVFIGYFLKGEDELHVSTFEENRSIKLAFSLFLVIKSCGVKSYYQGVQM